MSTLYLLRHAQASFGAADYDALSPLGEKQAVRLGEALRARGVRPDRVVSGTMRRQRHTAELCLAALEATPPHDVDADWNEYDHVALLAAVDPRYVESAAIAADLAQSKDPHRDFQRLFARAAQRWVGGAHDSEYAEPWPAFHARVERALDAIAPTPDGVTLVVTSGGVISAVCKRLLGLPDAATLALSWTLANAAITKLVATSAGGWRLASLNEQGHFEGEWGGMLTYR